jgi:predicted DNA-binding protein with PD1-like motif
MWQHAGLALLILACSALACSAAHPSGKAVRRHAMRAGLYSSPICAHALRLRPGDDLVTTLTAYCARHGLASAAITTCVGSLSALRLRLAGANDFLELSEPMEMVSLVGTIANSGDAFHLHASVSRADGSVVGGHVKGVATVATTAEVVLAELTDLAFFREPDAVTGYAELVVRQRSS